MFFLGNGHNSVVTNCGAAQQFGGKRQSSSHVWVANIFLSCKIAASDHDTLFLNKLRCKKRRRFFTIFGVARMQEATEMLKEVDAKLEPSDSWDLTSFFFVVPVEPLCRFYLNSSDDSKWLFHPSKWPETSNCFKISSKSLQYQSLQLPSPWYLSDLQHLQDSELGQG